MKTGLPRTLVHLALLAASLFTPVALAGTAPRISAEQLREDLAFLRQTIARVHPDLRFSTSQDALNEALDAIAAGARTDLTRDQAWQRLATLNPLFADAHFFVGYPDWRADGAAHLASGGALFPFEVDLDGKGQLSIRTALGGGASELAGARILAINGVPADLAATELLKRTHGDTPLFRAHLLAGRWWLYHWKLYGAAVRYRLDLLRDGRQWSVDVPASTQLPTVLQGATDFERRFGVEIGPGCTAVLKAGSFDGEFKHQFLALTRMAFDRMRQEGVSTLFIDISDNGGGDDDMWLEGLMPYIAAHPYRTGSRYTKRVLEANPARGEAAGQVIDGEIQTWRQPLPDNPLLFKGKVVVLIGPATYSSAVLFANVIRDFGFGTLAGRGHAARRTQSGGVRKYVLPHTGLALWAPRFVIQPPAGAQQEALLVPAPGLEQAPATSCPPASASR
ncbi:S41 family peptidase [Massilia niastensis]|uniref:S41 family peptidase n=1 Tax=Massilia niastensis TaxID=544911 RepID=UPI00039FD311|nr:S41 family peptidase [Massilia niastensis]